MFNHSQAHEAQRASQPPWHRRSWRKRISLIATPVIAIGLLIALLIWVLPSALGASGGGAEPKGYVGLFQDNAVAVFDASTNHLIRTIPVPRGPHGLVITPDGRRVYVSSDGASTVSVIDTGTDKVTSNIEVGKTPHGLAITPDGEYVLAGGFGTDQVSIIDTGTNQVIGRIPVAKPHNFAISPDGHTAYVSSQKPGAPALAVVNIEGKSLINSIPLDHTPRALNFSPDGSRLYFTQEGVKAVQVLDPATNHIVAQVPVGVSPHHPLLTPQGNLGLVAVQGPGDLSIFDPVKTSVIASVPTGKQPDWIATSADGRTAWVTDELSNDVAVVDLGSHQVTAHIPIGNAPRKIAVQSARQSMGSAAPAALLSALVVPN